MKEMPVKELFKLKPGEKFRVTWAKDDDEENGSRLNYTLQTVKSNANGIILENSGGYEWTKDEIISRDRNQLDTSRGIAYFFYP